MANKDYRPALSTEESDRADFLMNQLLKLRKKEEEIVKEIRKLMYKIDGSR